ncbi:MAG: hypothetical protein QXQ40_00555 [Candidatus Aenigmatarchaeota archaeon]
MKGYEEPTTTFIDVITIIIFTVFVIGSLFILIQFRTNMKYATTSRIAIDFGENLLSAECIADMKGVLNETKLDIEQNYYRQNREDNDGFSCLVTDFETNTIIETRGKRWIFGEASGKSAYFPALIKMRNGITLPATVTVIVSE